VAKRGRLAYGRIMIERVSRGLALLALLMCAPAFAAQDCDRSDSIRTQSPDGRWVASVQHDVCASAAGAVAGITVYVSPANEESRGQRVFVTAVPRSHDEWPRVRWQGSSVLQLRVPNLLEITAPPPPQVEGIRIELVYCGDSPQDRQRLADYKGAIKQWQRDVSAWVQRRKQDAEGAGPRPVRPEEPRLPQGLCSD
jgi:hypothetical protein